MKRTIIWFALLVLFALPSTASAQWEHSKQIRSAGTFGIGVGSGTLAYGLSMKYFTTSNFAIQGNIGYWRGRYFGRCGNNDYCRYYGGNSFALSADAIFEQATIAGNNDIELAWNFGIGGGLGLSEYEDAIGAAVAGILGLEVLINVIPIDLVLEWRPNALVIPGFGLDLVNFTGHLRFYF
ncbi:hypothetical protein FRD01_16485 [Microvenator marinus]|uniref:Uncharacterized protein n=1 Tax=Microvenator marinus TaxID=2600177 RepID=A0A5B8XYS0_9DELT|nr:hypothetical protein [Microvenator marinus]QED28806.1 hypothetical protein FRD01_16485 [Microvenator marinus]